MMGRALTIWIWMLMFEIDPSSMHMSITPPIIGQSEENHIRES